MKPQERRTQLPRTRKFDWDAAWKLYKEGVPVNAIALRMHVSTTAVEYALFPGKRRYMNERNKARLERHKTGSCQDCGKAILDTSVRCQTCNGHYQYVRYHTTERTSLWRRR